MTSSKISSVSLSCGFAVLCFASTAKANETCDQALVNAQRNCAAAIRIASEASESGQSQGLSGAAGQYADSLRAGVSAMNTATQHCEDQVRKCETACGPAANQNQASGDRGYPEASELTCIGGNCRNGRPTGPVVPCSANSTNCSPLVVQLGEQKLVMNPPSDGVWFDILGGNAPISYVPIRISWPTPASLEANYFLTLPKQSAMVLGIDELFGNNTRGPASSESFAENGFEALRKYDGRITDGRYDDQLRDGLIDAKDPVFADLRLWRDGNANGVAEFGELFTLDALSVSAIDLKYDPEFIETDSYGNVIKTKSAVIMKGNGLKLIFDLWFVSAR